MAYTVLARRYRSQGFDELVGQESIARALTAAIERDRVAHAYLFTGTRGVGKTSAARLLAKAINGGTPEVDRAIMTGQDVDVVEIDAASNRGVDDARDLIAGSVYRPLRAKRKIYIIDEAHMLTREASNALLKTMEEPPEHVVFVLCTTEPQKLLPTIQSRCQRFDFRNIEPSRIASHLSRVCEGEGVKADPELLRAVARMGNGSMRDALSLLDRLLATGERRLTLELLATLLGLPRREAVGALIDAVAAGDAGAALRGADELLASGVSIDQMLETVIERLRDLMVLAACGAETTLVELSSEMRAEEAARAARFDAAGLVHMIALCESVQRNTRFSSTPRALVDALMVRLAMTEKLAEVTSIVSGVAAEPKRVAKAAGASRGAGAKKR